MTMGERWRPPETLLGWGGRPSNHGPCRRCGEHIAWAIDLRRRHVLLQAEPDPAGTVLIRKNGTHMVDIDDPTCMAPQLAEAIRRQGYPLYVRHARLCGPAPEARRGVQQALRPPHPG